MKGYYFDENLCNICGKTFPGCDAKEKDITLWGDVDDTVEKGKQDQVIQCCCYQGR